jgi:hypothetical protein
MVAPNETRRRPLAAVSADKACGIAFALSQDEPVVSICGQRRYTSPRFNFLKGFAPNHSGPGTTTIPPAENEACIRFVMVFPYAGLIFHNTTVVH